MSTVTGEHYFTAAPGTAARERQISFSAAGCEFTLTTASSVFSAERLDPGTAVLLRKAPLPDGRTEGLLLDLGCGYGPITAVLATVAPLAHVVAVDVNERARDLARRNAAALHLDSRVRVTAPDEVEENLLFDQIWSNPPIRIGKAEFRITHVLQYRPDQGSQFVDLAPTVLINPNGNAAAYIAASGFGA